jgi:hypothetical protein
MGGENPACRFVEIVGTSRFTKIVGLIMLLSVLGLAMKTRFIISHHVHLNGQVISAAEIRQNGSLVGSKGWMTPSDGKEEPLIILRGKEVKVRDQTKLGFTRILGTISKNRFKVQGDEYSSYFAGEVSQGILKTSGNPIMLKLGKRNQPKQSPATPAIERLFPPPSAVDTGIEAVYWNNYGNKAKLGEIEFGVYVQSMWRAAYIDEKGKMSRLEDCVQGLKGYIVRGILHLDAKGWIAVDASESPIGAERGAYIGHGNHLFWLEPR